MTSMMCVALFFGIVGGALMAMIAVNEYYERKKTDNYGKK